MVFLLAAVLIGVMAGLRTMTAPAALSWADRLGNLPLDDTPLAFLGGRLAPWLLTLFALAELILDKLPGAPSRTVPWQFAARLVSGGFCGLALGLADGQPAAGLLAGMGGAVVGTLGGAAARAWLAAGFGRDQPAALLEDAVAIGGAILIVAWLP